MIQYKSLTNEQLQGSAETLQYILDKGYYPNGSEIPDHCRDTLQEQIKSMNATLEVREFNQRTKQSKG